MKTLTPLVGEPVALLQSGDVTVPLTLTYLQLLFAWASMGAASCADPAIVRAIKAPLELVLRDVADRTVNQALESLYAVELLRDPEVQF